MKLNLANKLTLFRIILVPIMTIIPYLNLQGDFFGLSYTYIWMLLIFIVASITDKLDGYIARSRNQVTTIGKFLDPIADKIIVLSALVKLVEYANIPGWIPVIVLAREFIVSGYRLIAVEKGGKVIAASIWGKLKTVTQMIAIILVFVDKYDFFDFIIATTNQAEAAASSLQIYMTQPALIFNVITSIIMLVSVVATIFSGYDYLKGGKDLFKDTNN